MKKPKFEWNDKVEFYLDGMDAPKVGVIEVVDAFGTFFQREFPSYDICVTEDNNSLYKHVPEPYIRRKVVGSESITRGVLLYDEKLEKYSVVYGFHQYAVLLDNPGIMEIRLEGMLDWVSIAFVEKELPESVREREKDWLHLPIVSLKEWIGKTVEIRYVPPHLQVCDLVFSHQNNNDMIYEVYREEANVVLFDGDFVHWEPENLIFRGADYQVVCEYQNKRVYRWDVVDGVMRLCLGRIPNPSPDTLDRAKEYLEMLQKQESKDLYVEESKISIVERLRRCDFAKDGLKRMVSWANYVSRANNAELLTPITKHGFHYQKRKERHRVYYRPGWILDAVINETLEDLSEEFYEEDCSSLEFIWGLRSYDDLTGHCDIHSLNDIELIYDKDAKEYWVSIETIYQFEEPDREVQYLQNLLKDFTDWMQEQGYATDEEPGIYTSFTCTENQHFKTIEGAYLDFKLRVTGFCELVRKGK